MLEPAAEADLIAWILRDARERNDPQGLITHFAERLAEAGLPLWRLSVAVPAIDPTIRAVSLNWIEGGGLVRVPTDHDEGDAIFQRSPIYTLIEDNLSVGRWRVEDGDGVARYPLLAELGTEGCTDYVALLAAFTPDTALRGTGVTIATKRPGGFAEEEIAMVERLLPALALAIFRFGLWYAARGALDTYLGAMTGRRVLEGAVRRGEGEMIEAAILLADLSGFTRVADRHEPHAVVAWLNEHLEVIGDAVLAEGGEILKFLGDGLLAVFPVAEASARPCIACTHALAAAESAIAANDAVNARRRSRRAPVLRANIALHFGEVIYGNVGTRRRLDFTTIGRAVNEASRIESLCGRLKQAVILSDSFASRCAGPFAPLGSHRLRGLAAPRALWGLAAQGQRTLGGSEDRIESTLPPVLSPKMVPRS